MSTLNLAIVLHRLQLHCGNKSNFVAMETQQQLLYALVDQRIHNYNCSNISDAVSEIQVNVSPLLSLSPIFSPCNSSPYSPLSSLLSPHLILHIPIYYLLSLPPTILSPFISSPLTTYMTRNPTLPGIKDSAILLDTAQSTIPT